MPPRSRFRKRKVTSRQGDSAETCATKDAADQCVTNGDDYVWDDFTVVDEVDNTQSEANLTSNTSSIMANTRFVTTVISARKICPRGRKRDSISTKSRTALSDMPLAECVDSIGLKNEVQCNNKSPCERTVSTDTKNKMQVACGVAGKNHTKKGKPSSSSTVFAQKPHVLRISLPHFNWLEEKIHQMMVKEEDKSCLAANESQSVSKRPIHNHPYQRDTSSVSQVVSGSPPPKREKIEVVSNTPIATTILLDDDEESDFDVPILSLPEKVKVVAANSTDTNHILIPPTASDYSLESFHQTCTLHAFLTNGIALDASEDESGDDDNAADDDKPLQINEEDTNETQNHTQPLVINLDPCVAVEDRSLPPKKWHYQSRQNIANIQEEILSATVDDGVVCPPSIQNKSKCKIRTPPLAARLKDRGPVQAVNPLIILDTEQAMEDSLSTSLLVKKSSKDDATHDIAKLKRKSSIVKVARQPRKSNKKEKMALAEELFKKRHVALELNHAQRASHSDYSAYLNASEQHREQTYAQVSAVKPLSEQRVSQHDTVYQSEGQLRLFQYHHHLQQQQQQQQQQHLMKHKLLIEQQQYQQQLQQRAQAPCPTKAHTYDYYRYEQSFLNKKIQQYQLQQQQKLNNFQSSYPPLANIASPYNQYYYPTATLPTEQSVTNHIVANQKLHHHINKHANLGVGIPAPKVITPSPTVVNAWRGCYPPYFQQYSSSSSTTNLDASEGMHYYSQIGGAAIGPTTPQPPSALPSLSTITDKVYYSSQQANLPNLASNRYPSSTFVAPGFSYDHNSASSKLFGEQTFYYTNTTPTDYHQSRPDYLQNKAQKTHTC